MSTEKNVEDLLGDLELDDYEGVTEKISEEDLAMLDEADEALKAMEAQDPTEIARIRAELVAQLEQNLAAAKKICEFTVETLIQAALEHLRR